jgi:hypothetical protein
VSGSGLLASSSKPKPVERRESRPEEETVSGPPVPRGGPASEAADRVAGESSSLGMIGPSRQ